MDNSKSNIFQTFKLHKLHLPKQSNNHAFGYKISFYSPFPLIFDSLLRRTKTILLWVVYWPILDF
jgi:hypothetical protein